MKKMGLSLLLTVYAMGYNIPVLDMEDFFNPQSQDAFVLKMYDAFCQDGVFCLINVPVEPFILEDVQHSMARFFILPLEKKNTINGSNTNFQRGYSPIGQEISKGSSVREKKEFLQFGSEMLSPDRIRLGYYDNLWPESVHLKIPVMKLYQAMEELTTHIEEALEKALYLQHDTLNQMTFEGDSSLRLIHYQCMDGDGHISRSMPHTDIDLFTIMPYDYIPSFKFRRKNGQWELAEAPPGCFLVLCGDMFKNLTNGLFYSPTHHVLPGLQESNGSSMTFFVHPRNFDRLDPLASCIAVTGGKQLYPSATRWEMLMERLIEINLATDDMVQEFAKTGLIERMLDYGCASKIVMNRLKASGLASQKVLQALEE